MEWIKPNENQPTELKLVLAWIKYFSMPPGEVIWQEEKKIEKYGYSLVYIDKGKWWDSRATINSNPLKEENIIGWVELPNHP